MREAQSLHIFNALFSNTMYETFTHTCFSSEVYMKKTGPDSQFGA